eukprot:scaffold4401_cov35-Phaeocystis_antarctica.AAC.1
MAMANRSLRRRSIAASLTIALEDQVARPIPAKRALSRVICRARFVPTGGVGNAVPRRNSDEGS